MLTDCDGATIQRVMSVLGHVAKNIPDEQLSTISGMILFENLNWLFKKYLPGTV